MPQDIDTRVSLSLHPESLTILEGYDEPTSKYIGDAVSAFNYAFRQIGRVHDATEAGKRNPAFTEAQRILEVGKMADRERALIFRKFDTPHATLKQGIAYAEGELSAPVANKAALPIAQEIRAHVKGLPSDERFTFLRTLIADGDELSVSAVLAAPAYLSGIDNDTHALVTRTFHEHNNPALTQRLTLLKATLEKLNRDAPLVFGEIEKAVGAPASKVNEIDAADKAAREALTVEAA